MSSQNMNKKDEKSIRAIMSEQEVCWNKGDIDCFMEGYWKSDELRFMGKNGITKGWQNTYDRYKKNYPDKATMGRLSFEIISIEMLGKSKAILLGSWNLQRETMEDVGGFYSLIWQKIGKQWYIILDHTS